MADMESSSRNSSSQVDQRAVKARVKVSEHIRIRRYVLNMIYHHAGKKILIPSLSELCREFQVSRPTACKAVQTLVRDGFLLVTPGVGTYTNPNHKLFRGTLSKCQNTPSVGIICQDGMMMFADVFFGKLLAALFEELAERHCFVTQLQVSDTTPEKAAAEILAEKLDGICALSPNQDSGAAIIEKLRESDIPLAVLGDEMNCQVFPDYERFGREAAERFLAAGCQEIVFVGGSYPHNIPLPYLESYYREREKKLTIHVMSRYSDFSGELRQILRVHPEVDGIFNVMMDYADLEPILTELAPASGQRLVIQNKIQLYRRTPAPGVVLYELPLQEYAQLLVENLFAQLHDRDAVRHHKMVPTRWE